VTDCPQCSAEVASAGARFCPRCGAPLAGPSPVEERKLVTVLFADITGSTTLGERFDPERWRALLQRFFSVMAASIEGWGGTVQKFAGDAVMATFGVPIVHEDDAERGLHAGSEMLERLVELNREFEARHGISLAIRVGVNTGEVVASPDQLLVIGDAVNVAARLEQIAEPGTMLAGERTYEAARGAFLFGDPEFREVRGKSAPVMVRRVLRPVAGPTERRPGLRAAMVGRDIEIETLASLFHEAMETASPRMVLIMAPAGMGKSRLIREFLNLSSARHPERLLLQGRCPAAGKNLTYWALGELLRRECAISLDDSGAEAADLLRGRVQDVLRGTGLPTADIERTIHALALTAGIRLAQNPLEQVRPSAVDLELAMAWPRYVSAYTSKAPVVLVVEDLHWADERLVGMLERLLARATGPLLILGTARPEFRDANPSFVAAREDVHFVMLRRLSQQQSGVLLDELLQRSPIDAALRDDLLASAEGNPFFLEEIVQRVRESGGRLQHSVPDSVQAVLAARIDALPIRQKRALQEAAVIGRVFWETPLRRATADVDVMSTLLALERRDLVVVRPTSSVSDQIEFAFKHALVRDVAYASLPLTRRARAHAEVASWLEEIAGDRREELSELIAHHYRSAIEGDGAQLAWADQPERRAELEARALEALLTAGVRARARFAVPLALELHTEARRLARSPADRLRVLEALGDDHEGSFHGDEAVKAWEDALQLIAEDGSKSDERVRLLLKCAKMTCIRWGGFKLVPPTRQVDGYIAAALQAGPGQRERGWLLAMRAYMNTRKGDETELNAIPRVERMHAGEEAAEIGHRLDDADLQVLALRALSGLWISNGDYERAMDLAHQESASIDRIAATRDRALSIHFYALRLMDIAGRYHEGVEQAERSYKLAKELTIHEVQHATFLLLYGNAVLGRWQAIEPLLQEHLNAWHQEEDITCPYARSGPVIGAWALAGQGRIAEARELVDSIPMDWNAPALPEAWRAMVLMRCGDPSQARSDAERILGANRRITYEEAPLEYIVMLDAMTAQRDWQGIVQFQQKAEAMRGGLALLGPACDRAAGALAFSNNDPVTGRQKLELSIAALERLGALPELARTRELLAEAVFS
jgi:class 3 adenylate cyclase